MMDGRKIERVASRVIKADIEFPCPGHYFAIYQDVDHAENEDEIRSSLILFGIDREHKCMVYFQKSLCSVFLLRKICPIFSGGHFFCATAYSTIAVSKTLASTVASAAPVMPFPRLETTPPVTKMCLVLMVQRSII